MLENLADLYTPLPQGLICISANTIRSIQVFAIAFCLLSEITSAFPRAEVIKEALTYSTTREDEWVTFGTVDNDGVVTLWRSQPGNIPDRIALGDFAIVPSSTAQIMNKAFCWFIRISSLFGDILQQQGNRCDN